MTKAAGNEHDIATSSPSLQVRVSTLKLMLHAAAISKPGREGSSLPDGPLDPFAVLADHEIARILSLAGIDG
jgi:hypothetical protein